MPTIIAIDGPSASGKGTLASGIAKILRFSYLNTGALYRAVAFLALQSNTPLDDVKKLSTIAAQVNFIDLSELALHTPQVTHAASLIAVFKEVRQELLEMQRNFPIGKKGAVIEGRDIGTVIFPNADLKLYITATLESRARRRYKQLQNTEANIIFSNVLQDLQERDLRDESRGNAPLKIASDYVMLDTTDLNPAAVCDLVLRLIYEKLGITST